MGGEIHIKLVDDIYASETDSYLLANTGGTVYLDLNGHVLSRNLSSPKTDGFVIKAIGTELIILDNSITKGGMITGGNNSGCGGGLVLCGAHPRTGFNGYIEGGVISGNTARYGGGVYVESGCFVLNGGSICHNKSFANGGGVYVDNQGGFISHSQFGDSSIIANSADIGGGIYYAGKRFLASSINVTQNIANIGGGIYFKSNNGLQTSTDYLGKEVFVSGNFNRSNKKDNLYLVSGSTTGMIEVMKGPLKGNIGVRRSDGRGMFSQVGSDPPSSLYNDGKLTASDVECFFSDDDDYAVGMTEDGRAYLGTALTSDDIYVEESSYDGTDKYNSVSVSYGGIALNKESDYELSLKKNGVIVSTASDSGYYTVEVAGKGSYAGKAEKTMRINPKEIALIWGANSFEYDGNPHVPSVEIKGLVNDDVCSPIINGSGIDAGRYMATITGLSGDQSKNYSLPVKKSIEFIINKTNPVVKKNPISKNGLCFSGKAQELVFAGETNGGTMYYAVTETNVAPADNSYTASIPTKINAGTYYVWYKVIGDKNHNDILATFIPVSIADTGNSDKPYDQDNSESTINSDKSDRPTTSPYHKTAGGNAIDAMKRGLAAPGDTSVLTKSGKKYYMQVDSDCQITVVKGNKFFISDIDGRADFDKKYKKLLSISKKGKVSAKKPADDLRFAFNHKTAGKKITVSVNIIEPAVENNKKLKVQTKVGEVFDFTTTIPLNAEFGKVKNKGVAENLTYEGETAIGTDGRLHIKGTAVKKGKVTIPFTVYGKKFKAVISVKQ